MEPLKDAVQQRDAAGLRTLLAAHAELRIGIDRPIFGADEPAIVFCRRDRAMLDVLLEFGADINARSQFWGRTVGVLDDSTPDMRAYLIGRGAVPEIDEFVEAVRAQDAAKVRTLLANTPALRPHIDRPLFSFGGQAILAAKNNRQVAETLLEFGANINARSDWWAGSFGVLDGTDPEQAAWLIERGAIVDIHAAAGLGMADKVKEWLASDPSLVHAPGGDGQRPLHFAKTKEIIDLLLDHGAVINARDIDHKSTAAQYKVRDTELCRHLIARGADVDVFMAAALGDRALVERVLEADPGCITARIGQSGYAAVPPGHIYQWELGANVSVLLVAANYGGQEVYDLLFRRSPIKEQFLAACRRADEANATKILAARPNLLQQLPGEDQAQLGEAAFAKDLPALQLMLKLGFDVNARGDGFTPVNRAALCGYVEIVRVLIEHGADLDIRNAYGGTALESCQWGSLNFCDRKGDYPACAETLLQAGAKLTYPNFGSEAVQAVLRRHTARN
ncbi:MAG: ankyrin repeat domain-containing protein [Acidobacteriota bacterium]